MIFSLLIYTSPNGQAERTALRFCNTALTQGHQIQRVFFYGDSVINTSSFKVTPRDEKSHNAQWAELNKNHEVDLVVCISAAVRRGVLDNVEAERHGKNGSNLEPPYTLSGLGQLADAMIGSDRLITFGS